MKRLLVMLVLMLFISGCADTDLIVPVRNVAVHRCRNWYDLCYFDGSHVTDVLRDAVELAEVIVIARAEALTEAEGDLPGALRLTHRLNAETVLFDRDGRLEDGASFEMHGLNGAATIGALAAVHAQPERIEAAGHDAEAYYIASECGAIPIEVGHTYLLFLTYDAEDAVYLPVGYEFQCEYIDGRLVSGDGMTKWRPDYNYEEILTAVEARTGRADEIGADAYRKEAYARKQAELAAAKAALRERMDAAAASRTGAVIPMRKRQIVHTIENDLFADDTLDERLAAAEAVVIARMDAMTLAYGMDSLKIGYDMTVEAVLCDSADALAPGDAVSVQGWNGLFAAWEVQELVGFFDHNIKEEILQEGYKDGDYVAVRNCGAIPAEVGKSYLIFLGTSPILRDFDYLESGGAYFFEYAGGKLYTGDGRKRRTADVRLADIENAIGAPG